MNSVYSYHGVTFVTIVVYNVIVSVFITMVMYMTFGLNGPTPPKGIQEAQNMKNNGGGGNLGYFQRGRQKKKKEKDEIDVFSPSIDEDEFLLEEDAEQQNNNLIDKVAQKFKKFFK